MTQDTHLFIVTGASRGLGLAMAERLLQPGHRLLCISRSASSVLDAKARAADVPLQQWTRDLFDPERVAAALGQWLAGCATTPWATATLINNAALVAQAGPVQDVDPAELSRAVRVGLEAPIALTNAFLAATQSWAAQRRVLNLSSGLGRRPMAGQAAYCAVKAGLDHFSRSVALDEARIEGGARIVSLAPGVIDTDMQVKLREADDTRFPDAVWFRDMKDEGRLSTPPEAARLVLAYLNRPDFGVQPVADVRDP